LLSRLLAIIEQHLAEEFVLVIDDAERPGERLLVDGVRSMLHSRGTRLRENEITTSKRQWIFASEEYSIAAFI
jgi:hypothetical protein